MGKVCKFLSVVPLLLAAAISVGPAQAFEARKCDRGAFGGYVQEDYKDTRARVLEAEVLDGHDVAHRIAGNGRIRVERGSWHDPFTGADLIDVPAEAVHIDHVIPVCWAWYHGADAWTYDKRRQFFNDIRFLLVVEAGLNRQKGSQGPDRFMPRNRGFACDYVRLFLAGIAEYGLIVQATEAAAIRASERAACGTAPATAVDLSQACDPNYSGACVPIAEDVDCAGGSGNGPAYVAGPVTVTGRDIYRLDSDGDGTGCEPRPGAKVTL